MKVSGANPVHALFAILRERIQGAQGKPGMLSRQELSSQAPIAFHNSKTSRVMERAARVDPIAYAIEDDVAAIHLARLHSNLSFAASDGVNKLSQLESGRNWEAAPIDPPPSPATSNSAPYVVHLDAAARFRPSQADIEEAMDILAALNSKSQTNGSFDLDDENRKSWRLFLGRFLLISVGVSILAVVVSTL
jgi:hypothetical protein